MTQAPALTLGRSRSSDGAYARKALTHLDAFETFWHHAGARFERTSRWADARWTRRESVALVFTRDIVAMKGKGFRT